jgi:NDP-sugar pyrophosphorylase family protein
MNDKIAPNEIFWSNSFFISEKIATFATQIKHSAQMKQAMIFAAGLGTRLKPLTDTMPKALVRVGGQPLIWHVIQKLKQSGYERIVVNVHHFAGQIVDYLKANDNFGLDIRISDETSQLLETGGGIKKALPLFDPSEPILIHNVDILSNLDLTALPMDAPLLVVSERKTKRYLMFDDDMRLQGWTNIETGELKGPISQFSNLNSQLRKLAFSGIHVFHPSLAPLLDEWPERFPIMDFYLKACGDHLIKGYEAKDLRLLDVGKLDTLDQAEAFVDGL